MRTRTIAIVASAAVLLAGIAGCGSASADTVATPAPSVSASPSASAPSPTACPTQGSVSAVPDKQSVKYGGDVTFTLQVCLAVGESLWAFDKSTGDSTFTLDNEGPFTAGTGSPQTVTFVDTSIGNRPEADEGKNGTLVTFVAGGSSCAAALISFGDEVRGIPGECRTLASSWITVTR